MNWDHIEDNWKQFSGAIKEKWDKLTEEEIAELKGKREQLEAKIQQVYHAPTNIQRSQRRIGINPETCAALVVSYGIEIHLIEFPCRPRRLSAAGPTRN